MSEFVFNLNGSPVSPETKSKLLSAGSKFESALSSGTPDSALTYAGNDNIVWDRVNGERLRRGLPSMEDIGLPRPPDDQPATAGSPNAGATNTFKVSGPPGLTLEQAQAIFKQQTSTGSLTGFKVGDTLSAATQAADGLVSAQASLTQNLGSLTGKLPAGTDLASITAGLGTTGLAAAGQVQKSLQGAIPAMSSLVTGADATINAAVTTALASPSAVTNQPLTGQEGQQGSIAKAAIATISKQMGSTPFNGINVADFVKQSPALSGIGNLSVASVTSTLAQASKAVGQTFDRISNSLGAGKFGFDASQLERAGMVKPGTAAAFLEQGKSDLVDVLKSPTVWTGKDGIKSLSSLLSNPSAQDKIQQGLMASGLNDVKSLGLPVDKLTPTALSGLATNAAKSVGAAMAWATNSPNMPKIPTVPGGDVTAAFNAAATNSAFAVKLSETKIEPALKQETPVVPAENTVNSETVDAAASRVVGNDKVPSITEGSGTAKAKVLAYVDFLNKIAAAFDDLQKVTHPLYEQSSITQEQWDSANQQYQVIRATFNARNRDIATEAKLAVEAMSKSDPAYAQTVTIYNAAVEKLSPLILARNQTVKQLIADLANKITV